MQSRWLEGLTWPEAELALHELPTVLLPLGARTKEHGHHLPLNNDWLIAEYLAKRVAEQCPVLVLPTLQYGFYPAFLEYPGSISVRWEACRDTIVDICRSLANQGAKRFYVLNTGISTVKPLEAARQSILGEGSRFEFTDIRSAYEPLRRQVETQPAGTHADEVETSMMLALAPEAVRMDKAVAEYPTFPPEFGREPMQLRSFNSSGVFGDPRPATAATGEKIIARVVAESVRQIEAWRQAL